MKKTREQLIQMMVSDAIADDYENFEKIESWTSALGRSCGLAIQAAEVVQAITALIESGLAKAYRLSPWRPVEEIQGVPSPHELRELYFWLTPTGRELQVAGYEGWPFDDEGALRIDWSPPSR